MNRCIALIAQKRCAHAWRPCRQHAHRKSLFCSRHENVLRGALLGLCIHSRPLPWEKVGKGTLERMPVAAQKPS